LLLCAAVLAGVPAFAGEEPTQAVESKITQVTVYGDRALVRRVATLAVKPGEYGFVFAGLPRWLDDDSLRAAGGGTAQARLLGIESKTVYTKETPEARVQALRDEVQALEDKIQVVTDELAVLGEQKDFISQLTLNAQQVAAQQFQLKGVDTDEWDRVVAHVGTTLGGLMQSARETNVALRELKQEFEIKQAELGRISTERVVQTKQVTVSVEALSEGTLELALDYVVGGATWRPLYDARADVAQGSVELTYYGTVAQDTGEDWTGVKLVLSTAQPAIGAQVPELAPWYLGGGGHVYDELVVTSIAARKARAAEDYEGEAFSGEDTSGRAEPARPQVATVQHRGASVVYEVKKAETIPSDNEPHRTTIGIVKLEGAMRYTVVPKLRETAFMQTEVKNTSTLHLLEGPVHVFLGPDFIGRAHIDAVVPDETFELSLGPDERIKVEREILKDRTKASKIRNRISVRNTIQITLENFTGKAASVVVKDQVPVSRDADITVKLIEATDRMKPNEATGELEWRFELAAVEKKVLTFEFEFSFPKEAIPQMESLAAESADFAFDAADVE
jgi:uncharacterized protein (TIGR02231 family)